MPARLRELAATHREALSSLASRLLSIPSSSGHEGEIAAVVAETARALGFDEVTTDAVGNVVAVVRGKGQGKAVIFLAHLDTAEVGEVSLWPHGPHAGTVVDGELYGLGAADAKGAIAAMLYLAPLLREAGVELVGDVVVACPVMAERAECLGVAHLFDTTLPALEVKPALAVLGDPTGLDLFLGQRGRLELEVMTIGRTSHASSPWLGVNAAYKMVPVISEIHQLAATLPSDPFLEKSTIALTDLRCTPMATSVVPDRCYAAVDRRYLPTESLDTILMQVQSLLNRVAQQDPEFKGEARVRYVKETSYTGYTREVPKLLAPFLTSEKHPVVGRVVTALEALDEHPNFDKWYFATEGGYIATLAGVPTVGYAPGEEKVAHTPYDRVKIDHLVRAAAGYAAIARELSGTED